MKKKLDKMSNKEILEELDKLTEEIKKLTPKVVGDLIRMNKSFYALTKDEKGREILESLRTDKDSRKNLFQYASAVEDLKGNLLEVEDELSSKIAELKKKQKEKEY